MHVSIWQAEASRGFEPRSLDSESRVLTVTPRGQLSICGVGVSLGGLAYLGGCPRVGVSRAALVGSSRPLHSEVYCVARCCIASGFSARFMFVCLAGGLKRIIWCNMTQPLCKVHAVNGMVARIRSKLTWLVLGGDPAARSHRVEQLTAL